MAFKLVSRTEPAPWEFYVTNDEAITYGQCLKFTSGRLTSAGDATAIAAISIEAVPATEVGETGVAGTDRKCKVLLTDDPCQIWVADYTGTADAAFIPGCLTADLASGDATIDAADVTGGKIGILKVDSVNHKAFCKIVGSAWY